MISNKDILDAKILIIDDEQANVDVLQKILNISGYNHSGNDSELMTMAQSIALTHHEKWDGTDYPHGFAGKNIPIEGSIASLYDVFDALISNGDLITNLTVVRMLISHKDIIKTETYVGLNGVSVYAIPTLVNKVNWGLISEISENHAHDDRTQGHVVFPLSWLDRLQRLHRSKSAEEDS